MTPKAPEDPVGEPDGNLELAEPGLGVRDDDQRVELVRHQPLRAVGRSRAAIREDLMAPRSGGRHPACKPRRLPRSTEAVKDVSNDLESQRLKAVSPTQRRK